MSMIRVEHLNFSYPGSFDPVFQDVSFQIDTDWKLGFVGRNGRGKTTFLRLLQGAFPYGGTISAPVGFDYFPYPVPDKALDAGRVLRQACPTGRDWELVRELSLLRVGEEVLTRPFRTLSNGEQTKVLLAALFLGDGRFPLIDEPTNHLDREGRETVSAYLRRKKGFLLVSHDRAFLDGCVDHILSINRTDIEVRSGNFSGWMEDFQQRQASERERNEQLAKDIGRLKQASRRSADWSERVEASKKGKAASGLKKDKGHVGHQAAKLMKRAKAIEARQEQAAEEKSKLLKNAERQEDLRLTALSHHADRLAVFSDVVIQYGDRPVCGPISFSLCRGDRIALTGRNGTGKSSLLRLLLGEPVPHRGTVETASGLVISYVPQDTGHLSGTLSAYAAEKGIDESLFKTILRKMDFERVQFEKDMADYSAGQKKKVLIAASLCERAHLYLWDEPLNYIDVYSRMQIEALLTRFQPTMLFVEHDAAFQENIATAIVRL